MINECNYFLEDDADRYVPPLPATPLAATPPLAATNKIVAANGVVATNGVAGNARFSCSEKVHDEFS